MRNVRFNLGTLRLDLELFFPYITTTGRFTHGVGRTPGNCRLQGNGAYTLRPVGLTQKMTSTLVRRGNNLRLGEMRTRVSINAFRSNIQDFVGTQQQSKNCNALLEQQMPRIFESQQQTISRYMESILRPLADQALKDMTLQDLLDLFLRDGGRPPVKCKPRL